MGLEAGRFCCLSCKVKGRWFEPGVRGTRKELMSGMSFNIGVSSAGKFVGLLCSVLEEGLYMAIGTGGPS